MNIRILTNINILCVFWNKKIKKFSLKNGQVLDEVGLVSDIFDSDLYLINWRNGSFQLNKKDFEIINKKSSYV